MNEQAPHSAVVLGLLTALPIFALSFIASRASRSFSEGWNSPDQGDVLEQSFHVSYWWLTLFIPFSLVLFASSAWSFLKEKPLYDLAIFSLVVSFGYLFILLKLYKYKITVNKNSIIYHRPFSKIIIYQSDISSLDINSSFINIRLRKGEIIQIPMIFGNLQSLGKCLYNLSYEKKS